LGGIGGGSWSNKEKHRIKKLEVKKGTTTTPGEGGADKGVKACAVQRSDTVAGKI